MEIILNAMNVILIIVQMKQIATHAMTRIATHAMIRIVIIAINVADNATRAMTDFRNLIKFVFAARLRIVVLVGKICHCALIA